MFTWKLRLIKNLAEYSGGGLKRIHCNLYSYCLPMGPHIQWNLSNVDTCGTSCTVEHV